MCHPPRLGIALLTTYVALATALIDGTRTLNLEYLPIDLSNQRPPQAHTHDMIHPRLVDLMASSSDRNGGFPDHPTSAGVNAREPAGNSPIQRTEDLEDLALAFLADKLRYGVDEGHLTDHRRRATLQDNDQDELMEAGEEADTKNRLAREALDIHLPREHPEMVHYLVNCRSGSLNWPPCALFNTPDTGPILRDSPLDIPSADDEEEAASDEDADDDDHTANDAEGATTRTKRDTETVDGSDEISRATREASQSHVLPSKMRKGFSPWGGKRVPPFGSWGGKRAPDFHSWGGKRAEQGGLKSHKKQMSNPSAWEGKRVPAFHSWGGKRAPTFNSWGGKRAPSFNSWGGKRAPFNSWGGKRGTFNSWGGKRAPSFNSWGGKRGTFNSWGGKRSLEFDSSDDKTMPAFTNWGGKRAPFNSWGGKRAPFNSWGGKRAPFNSWGGKRAPFNSWGGKRSFEDLDENSEDRLGQILASISNDDNQLSKVNEIENGEVHLVSDGPWVSKWPWSSAHFDKQKASEVVTLNKPPEK